MNSSDRCGGMRCFAPGRGQALLLLGALVGVAAGPAVARAQAKPEAAASERAVADSTAADGKSKEDQAKEHFAQGNTLFFEGKYPEAGLEYRRTLELMPNLANPHKNLARCYLALKQENMYPDAAFHLLRFIQLKPQDDDKKVASDLKEVIAALKLPGVRGHEKEEVTKLLEDQGTTAAEEEKWAVAVQRFEQLRDLHPERSDLLKLLAESYLGALRCADARRAYKAYLLVHPEEQEGLNVDSMAGECEDEAKQKSAEGGVPGKLVVLANVTGAAVLIDGKRVGNTPLDGPLRLTPGDHQLALFKEGYETLSRKVTLGPGATEQVELQLVHFDAGGGGGGGAPAEAEAGGAGGGGSGIGHRIALLPRVGLIAGLGGEGGTALGPAAGLLASFDVTPRVAVALEGGFHTYGRELSKKVPFTKGKISSTVLRLMAGAQYRHPFGQKLRGVGGLSLGLARAASSLDDDTGKNAPVPASVVLCVQAEAGAELALGPGSLGLTLSWLQQLNTISVSYRGNELVGSLGLGGLGVLVGYRYSF